MGGVGWGRGLAPEELIKHRSASPPVDLVADLLAPAQDNFMAGRAKVLPPFGARARGTF